jgi:hypothetical protein
VALALLAVSGAVRNETRARVLANRSEAWGYEFLLEKFRARPVISNRDSSQLLEAERRRSHDYRI